MKFRAYSIILLFLLYLTVIPCGANSDLQTLLQSKEDLKIAVVTAQTKNQDVLVADERDELLRFSGQGELLHLSKEYADLFIQNKREWAAYQGYDYTHTSIETDESAASQVSDNTISQSIHWVKIDLLQKYLSNYDWVCWMDMDTIIVDSDVKIQSWISHVVSARPHVSMILEGSEDYKQLKSKTLRTGILLLRNTYWTQRILSQLKEILADPEWLSIIRKEFHAGSSSASAMDDALAYVLASDHVSDSHLAFMTLQDRWNQQLVYMPKIGILHFPGCTTDNIACLQVFHRAVNHLLNRDEMYVYIAAPYVQHIYNIFVFIYVLFALDRLFHVFGKYFFPKLKSPKARLPRAETSASSYPFVVIQLPMFNETSCCKTIIDCSCLLDWPRSRILIQVVDDSTSEDTRVIIENCIWSWKEKGINIQLCRRNNRQGFKAGAMNEAMTYFPADAEYIAIFDADFLPQRSFLKATVPYLMASSKVAFVQTMWIYTNAKESLLTRMQEISLNYHFKCEQEVRSRSRKFFNFNGTAGVWRKKAMDSVGGWHTDTLVEDMDLSLRVWANGWDFIYLDDVKVLNEIPPTFQAYRGQQHRWTSGPMQVLKKAFWTVFTSTHLGILDKLFCIWFFLRNYVHIINFMYFLTLIPLMIWIPRVTLYEWAVIYLPAAISMSNVIFTPSEWHRVIHYVLFENAMCLYKTGALICGVLNIGKAKQWVVTPKFSRKTTSADKKIETSAPKIPLNPTRLFEKHCQTKKTQNVSQPAKSQVQNHSDDEFGIPDLCPSSPSPTMEFTFASIEMPPLRLDESEQHETSHNSSKFPYYRLINFTKAFKFPQLWPKQIQYHRNEMLMGLFLLSCSYYGILMRQYGISTFCLLNSAAYFILGLSQIGRFQ